MERFTQLIVALDSATRAAEKLGALEDYFLQTAPVDAAWALVLLKGDAVRRVVKTTQLRAWGAEVAGLPVWLVDECYKVVGDWAETLALLLPTGRSPAPGSLADFVRQRLLPLIGAKEAAQRCLLERAWLELDTRQCLLWHQLITGGASLGVSRPLLVRALARVAGVDPATMALRLAEPGQPTREDFVRLMSEETARDVELRPYPFFSALPRAGEAGLEEGGDTWQVEWRWKGLRAQLVRRGGRVALWSRRGEVLTRTFPEVAEVGAGLPEGTVLDGELLAWRGDRPLAFAQLQRRVRRGGGGVAPRGQVPVVLMVSDLLESEGVDWRNRPLHARRAELERVVAQFGEERKRWPSVRVDSAWLQGDLFASSLEPSLTLKLSPLLAVKGRDELEAWHREVRAWGANGLLLKRRDSVYGAGCEPGVWWEWEADPLTCDAVLVAAQTGRGSGGALFHQYSFALWDGAELVPVAKARCGLSDVEDQALQDFVLQNATGRFGPVRAVRPVLVFQLAFDAIAPSARHRSGIILQGIRIRTWRKDKEPTEADNLETLRAMAPWGPAK